MLDKSEPTVYMVEVEWMKGEPCRDGVGITCQDVGWIDPEVRDVL